MIRIGIVDDDKAIADAAARSIAGSIQESEDFEMKIFSSGEDVLDQVQAGERFDILFSDIQMTGMDGMELGRRLRELCPDMYIVFITSYAEYAAESYRIEAYQYILKQDMECRVPVVMRSLLEKLKYRNQKYQNQKYHTIGTNGDKIKLYYREIICIYKAKGAKYIQFVTRDGEYRERMNLEQISRELDCGEFLQVDRSCIVNMNAVCKVSGDTIYLEKDFQVRISKTKLSQVKQEISRYWRECRCIDS